MAEIHRGTVMLEQSWWNSHGGTVMVEQSWWNPCVGKVLVIMEH